MTIKFSLAVGGGKVADSHDMKEVTLTEASLALHAIEQFKQILLDMEFENEYEERRRE